jgi:flagellar hook assembly protein FlgD
VEEDEHGTNAHSLTPTTYALSQNYPNPFNPATVISYALRVAGEVTLMVYDVTGQQVRTLVTGRQEVGVHTVKWDGHDNWGRDVASGIYFYRITVDGGIGEKGNFTAAKRMMLVR